jgi:DNA topoisomerase IA
MSAARITRAGAELASEDGTLRLRTSASALSFPGYTAAYFDPAAVTHAEEGAAAVEQQEEAELEAEGLSGGAAKRHATQEAARAAVAALAGLRQGAAVSLSGAAAEEHETRPPLRFTEGGLFASLTGPNPPMWW